MDKHQTTLAWSILSFSLCYIHRHKLKIPCITSSVHFYYTTYFRFIKINNYLIGCFKIKNFFYKSYPSKSKCKIHGCTPCVYEVPNHTIKTDPILDLKLGWLTKSEVVFLNSRKRFRHFSVETIRCPLSVVRHCTLNAADIASRFAHKLHRPVCEHVASSWLQSLLLE